MQVNVSVEVALTSGAKVALTQEQTGKVREFVTSILFNSPVVREKRKYTRRIVNRRWTESEVEAIKTMMTMTGKHRRQEIKRLATAFKRTRSAIHQKAHSIKLKDEKNDVKKVQSFDFFSR